MELAGARSDLERRGPCVVRLPPSRLSYSCEVLDVVVSAHHGLSKSER
jgi:hypothetical protein